MKKLLAFVTTLSVLLFFNAPLFAQASCTSITLDNTGGASIGSATLTISFAAAANTLIVVGAEDENQGTLSATWNGVSMTKDVERDSAVRGLNKALFSIVETTGGTHNIVVTGGAAYTQANIASFLGTAKNAAFVTDFNDDNTGHSAGSSTVDTTGNDNAVHVMNINGGGTVTAGAGTQILGSVIDSARVLAASSPLSVTPAGVNKITVNYAFSGAVEVGAAYAASCTAATVFDFGKFFGF